MLADNRIATMSAAPGDRPMPPLRRLREAGVERAMLLAYRSGFRTDELLHITLDIVTRGGAVAMGLDGYGLAVGCRADFAPCRERLSATWSLRGPRARGW